MIKALKKENLEESMDMLIKDDQQYFDPGFITDIKNAQNDTEWMLSARRSIKLLQSIKALSGTERETKCDQLFSKALQAHSNAFLTILRHETDPSSPINRQSLGATTAAMCAAMFITADMGRLDLLSRQFVRLDESRSAWEPRLLAHESAKLGSMAELEYRMAPDNRFQVNVLRLAAVRADNGALLKQVDAECALTNMKTSEIPIVAWDARTTWFDARRHHAGISIIDRIKGVSNYTFYDWDSGDLFSHKDKQERLVRKLRSIILNRL